MVAVQACLMANLPGGDCTGNCARLLYSTPEFCANSATWQRERRVPLDAIGDIHEPVPAADAVRREDHEFATEERWIARRRARETGCPTATAGPAAGAGPPLSRGLRVDGAAA